MFGFRPIALFTLLSGVSVVPTAHEDSTMVRMLPANAILRGMILAALLTAAVVVTGADRAVKNIRIIYTNDTVGYVEPCGCGGMYRGGLSRRVTAIARLVKENPNCVVVDSGNLSDTAANLEIVAAVMSEMKYDAVGIGEMDRRYAEEFFKWTSEKKLTVLDTAPSTQAHVVPYLVKQVGGVKVGVVSFGVGSTAENWFDVRRKFYSAYRAARDASDVLILLDQGGIATKDWLGVNAARLGAPDIVIGGIPNSVMPKEEVVGRTHIVPTSVQGKDIGVIDVKIAPGRDIEMTVQRVAIDRTIPEGEATSDKIREFVSRPGRELSMPTPQPGRDSSGGDVRPSEKHYYPPEICKSCHTAQYEDWRKTKHARAMKVLVDRDRVIPDCLRCHSEAFRQTQKPPNGADAGVGCFTCHINALPHGMEGPGSTADTKVEPAGCLTCHTKDRSPAYDEKAYFPKVRHTESSGKPIPR